MSRIRKGDLVEVIAGNWSKKDEGEAHAPRGVVLEVLRNEDRIKVEGINLRVRHTPVRPVEGGGQEGGIIEEEAPMSISNVAFVDPVTDKPVRLGVVVKKDGTKVRVTRGRNSSNSEV